MPALRGRAAAVLALVAGLALGGGAGASLADGDPASDVLFAKNVFFPYPPPSRLASDELLAAVSAVYAKHYRIKVALIASQTDLGAIPSLFGKPRQYAQFLGQELSSFYAGPLLIVMRAGFGIYDAGRSTAAEQRVLAGEHVGGASADELADAATSAVGKLLAAGALASKDIRAPIAYPYGAVRRTKALELRYLLLDDSGRASASLWVLKGKSQVLARFKIPLGQASAYKPRSVVWPLPHGLPRGPLTFCASGADAAGNRSRPVCGPLRIQPQ
jgi:hypothetical protein